MNILECKHLSKAYKKNFSVLEDFNIEIPEGKIVGLLGPNGCGKSTLMKLISGLLQADEGEILVAGNPVGEKSKALISYLPERTYFSSNMKVSELVDYFEDFYEDFSREKAMEMLQSLNIDPSEKMKTLSKGTKEKVQLILVMSRNADLYILDEPIAGVDPAARDYILRTIVTNYNPEATVLISTHLIEDVEQVLDEVIFMRYGQLVLYTSVDMIREKHGKSVDAYFREVFAC